MHSDKKMTKEDTWKPAELRRHIRDGGYEEDRVRRREENERKHGGGETVERRHHRDPDKEHRRDRDRHRERDKQKDGENNPYLDNTRERDKRKDEGHNPYLDRRKEGSRDRRADGEERDKEKRRDRERVADPSKHNDERGEHRDRRHIREEKDTQDRERDRQREKERRREREREDGHGRDRDKRREERDRERRREERDREHGREKDRKRPEEGEEMGRDGERRRDREREKPNEEGERQKHESRDKERRERHADRRHSEHKEEQVYKEDRQKEREDRERRHKERGHHDEKWKHDSDGHHHGDRDRRDRDKHRERRHREEADPEADEMSTPKPYQGSRDKTTPSEIKVGKDEEKAEVLDYVDQDYEDDFEKVDYEEDFEDESGGEGEEEEPSPSPVASGEGEAPTPQTSEEIKAIRRAMDEENERVGTAAQSRHSSNTDQDRHTWSREAHNKNQRRGSQRGKFINFVAAKQREVSKQVANKQKKRSTELLRLIDLDFSSTFSLLDLPPVSEYDMYIKSFGNTNTKQAYVQCNEDNVDRDIQTEDIEMSEKWTQHPAERHGPCGDPRLSQDGRDKSRSEMNIDTQRLTTFLLSASQVMVVLLEEDYAHKQSLKRLSTKAEILSFSDGSLQFNTKLSFLNGRRVSLVHFSPVQNQTMMSVHSPTGEPGVVCLDTWTMICIWNIWEPSRPQKILVYESEVECCCFSPGKATLVFAGTSVGSVLLWDLRERAGNHDNLKVGEDEWTFRHPTFSTDAVLATSGHLSSVCCVEVVPSVVAGGLRPEASLLASDEESSGLSFQLASLDVNGLLNQWVVLELPKASDAGSQTDLGLRPGGKVKLLHSSSLLATERTSPRDAMNTGSFQTLLLRFLPTDSNHFFIGTNMGVVNHGTSHGLKAPPKLYRSRVVGVRPTDVTSIHFSPFSPALFLVGCGDGSVRLHAASQEQPVLEWNDSTAGEPVVSVQWTRTRPAVFCVLDAASNLHIWDLQRNDLEPAVTERIHADRVTAMSVFGDSGQQNTYSGVALAHESGKLQVQYFNERFTVPSAAEPETLESMINDAF